MVRLLEELGLFFGEYKDENGEAFFFLRLNDWLISQGGGRWDHPQPFEYMLADTRLRSLAADYLHYMLDKPRVMGYLGWNRYRRYRDPRKLDVLWGWKDPRNTYTLPLWLDLFPEAKVINIYRHGVDVARSLRVREEATLSCVAARYKKLKPLYWLRPKRAGFTSSPRCLTLEGAFSLWEEYVGKAQEQIESLGSRALTLKYEDFLADPDKALHSLAAFCGISTPETEIPSLVKKVREERAYAYRRNPELVAFAETVAERLGRWGYRA